MSNTKSNRLMFEKSPYLLQHAHNPVDWYPWGPEAFKKAEDEAKPIFLSIGYSTCHWCHVMEKESFEDAEVAKLLNDAFVCIKVDREERPDLDSVYMKVCQTLTGSGVNYGSADRLMVGWAVHYYYSFVRFDLSSIPSNAYILSAQLGLCVDNLTGPANYTCQVYEVTGSWDESNVTGTYYPTWASNASDNITALQSDHNVWLFANITGDVRTWQNNPATNNGSVIATSGGAAQLYLYSRHYSDARLHPVLEVSYLSPSPTIVVDAFDHVAQQPVSGMLVQLNASGVSVGNSVTNSSGVTSVAWQPTSNTVYNVTVSSVENGTYAASISSCLCDFRWPTNITSQTSNQQNPSAGSRYTFNFDAGNYVNGTLSNGTSCFTLRCLGGIPVQFYVSGTFTNGTSYSFNPNSLTQRNGTASFNWTVPSQGTYSVRATFNGNNTFSPCQACMSATANTTALAILLSVSPSKFSPGANIMLNATILDLSTGALFAHSLTVRFYNFSSDASISSFDVNTSNGMAIQNITYPNDGKARAFLANVSSVYQWSSFPQTVASNPLQLTVSNDTALLLSVTRPDNSSAKHLIGGWLKSGGAGVSGKSVTVSVNRTSMFGAYVCTATTNGSGYFSFTRDLHAEDRYGFVSNATYTITASFAGDTPVNVSASARMLDGTSYAACTTIQYGYKPSGNSTTLAVSPQSTQATTPTKTPEQMQQDAQNSGWLTIYNEWSWWYPWYRLHVKITLGSVILDIGFSPILPFGTTFSIIGIGTLASGLAQITEEVWQDTAVDLFGLFVSYIASKALSIGFEVAGLIAIGVKGVVQWDYLLHYS